MYEGFDFSTSLLMLVIIWFFGYKHPSVCEVVSHCGFDFLFPDD